MAINKVQLKYKRETGLSAVRWCYDARVGKWGGVIIDDPDELAAKVTKDGAIEFIDDDYVRWLEELAIEYFKLKQEEL